MWQCTVNPIALLIVLAAVTQHIMKWWMNPLLLLSTAPIIPLPLNSVPGARWEPHSSPAQPVGGPGSVHGGGPGWISGRAAPHHAGRRPAQAAQQWQLLRGRAAIQAGATDGPSQHGEEGRTGWRDEWRRGGGDRDGLKDRIMNGSVP